MKQTVFLKRAACLLLAILASLSLAACGTESKAPESTAPVTHAYDPAADGEPGELCVIFYGKGEDTAGHDLSVWDRELISSHKDDSAPETASIELMGKTFEGKYSYSAVFYPATHLSHVYTGEFGGFAISAETGGIDSFHASYAETEKKTGEDECSARADAVAGRFIDTAQYVREEAEIETGYYYTYVKYVEGLPTSDKFGVGISFYGGGITAIGASLYGTIDVTDELCRAVRRLKQGDADAAIKAKVESRYLGEYEMSYDELSVALLPDGTPTLMTTVEVSVSEKDVVDGESYFYPHTSAYDAYIFETASPSGE